METPKRYHPVLVTLHWLIVLLVLTNLFLGFFEIEPVLRGGAGFRVPDSIVTIHMAVGIAILVLLVIRLFVRIGSRKPVGATSGNSSVDILARVIHYALYFVVFALTVVGLVFALQTNRLQRAFFGGGPEFSGPRNGNFGGFPTPGPGTPQPSFGRFPTPGLGTPRPSFGGGDNPGFPGNGARPGGPGGRFGLAFFLLPLHLDIAIVLAVLIALHILAALHHQLILKDNLLARMWYGKA